MNEDLVPNVERIDPQATIDGATLASMNFLNEAAGRYPDAISLAAGRPPNSFIESRRTAEWLQRFVNHRGESMPGGVDAAWIAVGQYADTSGTIRDLIARYLEYVDGVPAGELHVRVTNGFQEALLVELSAIARARGAVITLDPTYVGLTGAAMVAQVPLFAVSAARGVADALAAGCAEASAQGFRKLACYLIPDYDNPTGRVLDTRERLQVLEVARSHDMTVFEDTAYRLFNYEVARAPSLLKLDSDRRVVQLGSFSKLFMPGVRIGFTATKSADANAGDFQTAVKSFVSVTTSPLAQAIVGGFLLDTGSNVDQWNAGRLEYCRKNRDAMLEALQSSLGHRREISWSRPEGGFFVVVQLPFEFGADETVEMAKRDGVIVTPMTFFSPTGRFRDQVRLSFSTNDPALIRDGVTRFAAFVTRRLDASKRA